MIIYNEPCDLPDESDMDDPCIAGMHPSEWPTIDDLLDATDDHCPSVMSSIIGGVSTSQLVHGESEES